MVTLIVFMAIEYIDINKMIPPKFGLPDNPEKDEKLIELITKAEKKEIPVYEGIVDINAIKPFCTYKPKDKDLQRSRPGFIKDLHEGNPRFLLTYQEGDKLIMSDDYYAYYLYVNEDFVKIPCVILGETTLTCIENRILSTWS